MGVEAEHEGDKKVMRVPECFKCLLSYPMVSGGVHKKHAKQHDMSRDPTGLGIMNLDSGLGSNLIFLNVEETAKPISRHLVEGP